MPKKYADEYLEALMAKAAARDQKEESWGISTRVARLEESATGIRENLARQDTVLETVLERLDRGFRSTEEAVASLAQSVRVHTSELQTLQEERGRRESVSARWGKIKVGLISGLGIAAIGTVAGFILRHLHL